MKTENVLILERDDIIESSKYKNFFDVEFNDFSLSTKPFQLNGIIFFIDDNGYTKILRNRYGDEGNVMTEKRKKVLEDVLKMFDNHFSMRDYDIG